MGKAVRFLGWPWERKKLLFNVLVTVVWVRIGLWVLPYSAVRKLVESDSTLDSTVNPILIDEIARFTAQCSRLVPQATCLTQSLAVKRILQRLGQDCRLRIGVAKEEGLVAHAWIEANGKIVIGRTPDISRYFVLSSVHDA